MVRDPINMPSARLPDGFGSASVALSSRNAFLLKTDSSGNNRNIFIGHPGVLSMGLDPSTVGGGIGLSADGQSWITGIATTDLQATTANPDCVTWNTYGSKFRPLAAGLLLKYIGPHGDSQKGDITILQGDTNWSNVPTSGATADWVVPFWMATTSGAVTISGDNYMLSNEGSRTYPVGRDVYVPISQRDLGAYQFRDLGAAQQSYAQTWKVNPVSTAVASATQYSQFAGVGSIAVFISGAAASSSVYRAILVHHCEITPQVQYNALLEPISEPANDAVLQAAQNIAAKLKETCAIPLDGSVPYSDGLQRFLDTSGKVMEGAKVVHSVYKALRGSG